MQLYPIRPMLNAPGTCRFKLEYDQLLSSFAFKFNLLRYKKEARDAAEMRLVDEAWVGTSQYCPTTSCNLTRNPHATSCDAFEPLLLESYLILRFLNCVTYYGVASNACQATLSRQV